MKKIAIILAVRHNSTRLFGKVLLPLANEDSMTSLIIKRLRSNSFKSDVIVATTEASFPFIEKTIKDLNASFYVGSEANVLTRYKEASEKHNVDIIVRATGDNPLVSVKALDLIVEHHIKTNADLSYYDLIPHGSGVEVIGVDALKYASDHAKDDFEKEHITQYIYRNSHMFKIEKPTAPKEFQMESLITTVDTLEQYENVSTIFERYNNDIYIDIDTIIKDIKHNGI